MKTATLIITILLFSSCTTDLAFTDFCDATLEEDFDFMADYIDDILWDLPAFSIPQDPLGHEENLFILIDELRNRNNCLDTYIECYDCIFGWPSESEIRIDINDGGLDYSIVVIIATPEFDTMYVTGFRYP